MARHAPVVLIAALVAVAGTAAAQADGTGIDELTKAAADAVLGAPMEAAPTPAAPQVPTPGVGLGALGAGLLLSGLIAGGIRHVTRHNVLDHPARQRIYQFLRETGGANLRTIADRLELSTTNATWHLDKLLKAEVVGEVATHNTKMYYPRGAGRVARDLCQARSVLSNDNARAVLDVVRVERGAHQREIARVLGVNHGTVRWHLQRLEEAGLVRGFDTAARVRGFEATPLVEQVLAPPSGTQGPLTQVPEGNL